MKTTKEPHKIHLRREVWTALTSLAEKEGITIDELIAKMINTLYAWNIPEPPKHDNNNNMNINNIKEAIKRLVEDTYLSKLSRHEYVNYVVLYCNECRYISVVSTYSLAEWQCDKLHKMQPLGTLNNFY